MVIDKTDEFVAKMALNMRHKSRAEQLAALRNFPNPVQAAVLKALDSMDGKRRAK